MDEDDPRHFFKNAIHGPAVASAVVRLCALADQHDVDGPGSITPALVWYREGVWEVIPTTGDGGSVTVLPPPGFAAVLDSLRPLGGW